MLQQILQTAVERNPHQVAIVYGTTQITYQTLWSDVCRLGQGLQDFGVQEGDCVALLLPNRPEFITSFFAIAQIHGIAVFLNPALKENELNHYIQDSHAKVIITDIHHEALCQRVIAAQEWPIKLVVVDAPETSPISFQHLVQHSSPQPISLNPFAGDALYQYSSGSTGRPKRVCRTQHNIWHQAENCVSTLAIQPDDRILNMIPLFHAYGFGECLLAAMHSGATLFILEPVLREGIPVEVPFIFRRAEVLALLQREAISIFPSVPYVLNILATTPPEEQVNLSNLRLCISAGNYLPQDIFDRFLQRFGIPIRQLYGCTEAGSVSINLQPEATFRYDSVGQPMHNVEIRVVDQTGQQVPQDALGELVIYSQTLTCGYHQAPELNREVFQGGGFFTGDLGHKDQYGALYITGRKKLFIDTAGYKVDPMEIEDVLATHPAVKEVVVVGVPQASVGEIIKAVVVCQEDCTAPELQAPELQAQELQAYCKTQLADFKVPQLIEFRTEIPRSPLGKILRKDLI
jgi:long-chain acyl-CoA synthetase